MPLIATRGAASAQGFGEFAQSAAVNYIEDVFSTWLYTGTGSALSIVNNIDLSTKGGLVWLKNRTNATDHGLFDTVRGAGYRLISNTTDAQNFSLNYVSSFNTTGFSLGAPSSSTNANGDNYASWTFREQPKFFDIVTYTGNSTNRTIAHNLGSAPGCMFVKCTSDVTDWAVYHRSLTSAAFGMQLNTIGAQFSIPGYWNSTAPTSTVFSVGTDNDTNGSGRTYVAYLFAHNAGGFGLTGADNVISCGSYTGNGSSTGPVITLGYEPQWLMIKRSSGTENWVMHDVMRGMPVGSPDVFLGANLSDAESGGMDINGVSPTATGFDITSASGRYNTSGSTYIYIAIRRGPMKVPTDGTSVYNAISYTGDGTSNRAVSVGFTPDMTFGRGARSDSSNIYPQDRLRGLNYLSTQTTDAEGSPPFPYSSFSMTGIVTSNYNNSLAVYGSWAFKRAPGFFDEVCYTGDGASTRQITHNLTVVPELIIVKRRDGIGSWEVRYPSVANNRDMLLNLTNSQSTLVFTPADTSTTFTVSPSGSSATNDNAQTYVAYLFATCPGVSKVGSYTGTGATQTINCGFTGGARFVLVKRTNSTGDWYVWDTARGMVAGTDPSLLLNSTAAEVNANSIYTAATGFQIVSTAAGINASGGSYIFLAIA
jgi:hypothetical protein